MAEKRRDCSQDECASSTAKIAAIASKSSTRNARRPGQIKKIFRFLEEGDLSDMPPVIRSMWFNHTRSTYLSAGFLFTFLFLWRSFNVMPTIDPNAISTDTMTIILSRLIDFASNKQIGLSLDFELLHPDALLLVYHSRYLTIRNPAINITTNATARMLKYLSIKERMPGPKT